MVDLRNSGSIRQKMEIVDCSQIMIGVDRSPGANGPGLVRGPLSFVVNTPHDLSVTISIDTPFSANAPKQSVCGGKDLRKPALVRDRPPNLRVGLVVAVVLWG